MRVMVVDHHAIFRQGIIGLIKDQANIEIVGVESPGARVVELARTCDPDIILMGASFFEDGGMETMRHIFALRPDISLMILTHHESADFLLSAFRNGAEGYLLDRNISQSVLLKSLDAIERGEIVLSRSMSMEIVLEFQRNMKISPPNHPGITGALTYREKEILRLLGAEATNKEIARRLLISDNTVRVHVHKILIKLRAKNRHEAARFAKRLEYGGYDRV